MESQKPISVTEEKLVFDLRPYVTWFNNKKCGGQNSNKLNNLCRINHTPSGVSVSGTKHRDRSPNLKDACEALKKHPKFRYWCQVVRNEYEARETLEEYVDKMMDPKNLKIEVKEDGKWVEE